MATDHMRFPRSRQEVREQVLEDLGADKDFITTSEIEALVDYHQEREQNEG